MAIILNENTVDEYTAQLDQWAEGIVSKIESIPKQYADISDKVAEIDTQITTLKDENLKKNMEYESKVSEVYNGSEKFQTAFGTIHDLNLYILTHKSFDCLYRNSYLLLDESDRSIVDDLIVEKEQRSEEYSTESSVLNRKRDKIVYGENHFINKEFTQLEKLSVDAIYCPFMLYTVLSNFGVNGGLFATHLKSVGLMDRLANKQGNLDKIAKSIDPDTKSKYIEENKETMDDKFSLGFPQFGFDFAKYESLLAQKIGLTPDAYASIFAKKMKT